MPRTIGLVHATMAAIQPMRDVFAERLPQVKALNFLDEGLLTKLNETGSLTPQIMRRMENLVLMAQYAGAEVALLTCSAFSPIVDVVQTMVDIPLFKIDETMIQKAVKIGRRIGMIATVAGTYQITQDLIHTVARAEGKTVSVQPVLLTEAFDALLFGRTEHHDALIVSQVQELASNTDVIVLAQVSMARVLGKLPPGLETPVLSSPTLAVDKVKEVLGI